MKKKTRNLPSKPKVRAAPQNDEFERTRQMIAELESAGTVFLEELRKLPQWQQRAIVDEVYQLASHGLRYLRIVVAGISRTRTVGSRSKTQQRNAANADFAEKFVEAWTKRSITSNGQAQTRKKA